MRAIPCPHGEAAITRCLICRRAASRAAVIKRRALINDYARRAMLVSQFIGAVSTEYLHELIGYKPPRSYKRRNTTSGADTC